jgi:hypothetical protein
MVTGVLVGRIKEQHSGHIILSDSSRLSLAKGLSWQRFHPEELVTITYERDSDGGMIVRSITRSTAVRAHYTR